LVTAELRGVTREYHLGTVRVEALRGVDISIMPDRFTVLIGPSGSGKTTLLNMIGCIDRPTAGSIHIDGQDVQRLGDDALADFRSRHIGFVFQNFNLLPVLTAYENVEYPMLLAGAGETQRRTRVNELLDSVGLLSHARHTPSQLSGGQQQRVAIARALANQPRIVLADEPTANLDSATGEAIISLMRELQRHAHVTFVFSSHDPTVIGEADDVVHIRDGRVVEVTRK